MSLMQFSINNFVDSNFPRQRKRLLQAEVMEDGDYYIINPTPSDPIHVYRIHRQYVALDALPGPANGSPAQKLTHSVTVQLDAPCMRLSPGHVDDFFPDLSIMLATLRASIAFQASGEGTLTFDGNSFPCLGKPGLAYPVDLTVRGIVGTDKFLSRYSSEFGVQMPFAVLIWGARGIFIHEGPDNLKDNDGPSQGCIHLAPGHAQTFYDWVSGPTRILITRPW